MSATRIKKNKIPSTNISVQANASTLETRTRTTIVASETEDTSTIIISSQSSETTAVENIPQEKPTEYIPRKENPRDEIQIKPAIGQDGKPQTWAEYLEQVLKEQGETAAAPKQSAQRQPREDNKENTTHTAPNPNIRTAAAANDRSIDESNPQEHDKAISPRPFLRKGSRWKPSTIPPKENKRPVASVLFGGGNPSARKSTTPSAKHPKSASSSERTRTRGMQNGGKKTAHPAVAKSRAIPLRDREEEIELEEFCELEDKIRHNELPTPRLFQRAQSNAADNALAIASNNEQKQTGDVQWSAPSFAKHNEADSQRQSDEPSPVAKDENENGSDVEHGEITTAGAWGDLDEPVDSSAAPSPVRPIGGVSSNGPKKAPGVGKGLGAKKPTKPPTSATVAKYFPAAANTEKSSAKKRKISGSAMREAEEGEDDAERARQVLNALEAEAEKMRKMRQEKEAAISRLRVDRENFELYKSAEIAKIEQWRDAELAKVKKERRALDRERASIACGAVGGAIERRHREEIAALQKTVAELKETLAAQKTRHKATVDRLQKTISDLTARNDELERQLKESETARLSAWERAEKAEKALTAASTSHETGSLFAAKAQPKLAALASAPPTARTAPSVALKSQTSAVGISTKSSGENEKTKNANSDTSAKTRPNGSSIPMNAPSEKRATREATHADHRTVGSRDTPNASSSISAPNTARSAHSKALSNAIPPPKETQSNASADFFSTCDAAFHKARSILDTVEADDTAELQDDGDFTEALSMIDREPPLSESVLAEGKIERRYAGGTRVLIFSNGTRKVLLPSGKAVVQFTNGDIKRTYPTDKRVVYYYAAARTTHVTLPNGVEVFRFPNGQLERHWPDGTKSIIFADGTEKLLLPSGDEENVFPDGTVQRMRPSTGEKLILFRNGQKEKYLANGERWREYPDGVVKISRVDGTSETRWPGGRIRRKDSRGEVVLDTGDESADTAELEEEEVEREEGRTEGGTKEQTEEEAANDDNGEESFSRNAKEQSDVGYQEYWELEGGGYHVAIAGSIRDELEEYEEVEREDEDLPDGV